MNNITKKILSTIMLFAILLYTDNFNYKNSFYNKLKEVWINSTIKAIDEINISTNEISTIRKGNFLISSYEKDKIVLNYSETDDIFYFTIRYSFDESDNKKEFLKAYDFKENQIQIESYDKAYKINEIVNSKILNLHKINLYEKINEIILKKGEFKDYIFFYNTNSKSMYITIIPKVFFEKSKQIIKQNNLVLSPLNI